MKDGYVWWLTVKSQHCGKKKKGGVGGKYFVAWKLLYQVLEI
jgi:hypothetical protein